MTDVTLLRMKVRPGWPERLFDAFATVQRFTHRPGLLRTVLDRLTDPVLEEEGMYTESVFLERAADGYYLLWYMEAAEMDRVYEAYDASDHPLTDASEWALNRVLEVPEGGILAAQHDPGFDLLVHATNPDRPGRVY